MTMQAVKICAVKEDGNLWSYCLTSPGEGIQYELGKITRRGSADGPLACFDTIENALRFFRDDFPRKYVSDLPWDRYKFFLCEVEQSTETELWKSVDGKIPEHFHLFLDVSHIRGIVTAHSVKLIREIEIRIDDFDFLQES